jgi:hypothetical protein
MQGINWENAYKKEARCNDIISDHWHPSHAGHASIEKNG